MIKITRNRFGKVNELMSAVAEMDQAKIHNFPFIISIYKSFCQSMNEPCSMIDFIYQYYGDIYKAWRIYESSAEFNVKQIGVFKDPQNKFDTGDDAEKYFKPLNKKKDQENKQRQMVNTNLTIDVLSMLSIAQGWINMGMLTIHEFDVK